MKRKLQAILLAGALVVPTTALGASEPLRNHDISQRSFAAFQTASTTIATTTSNDTVNFDINDVRLKELYTLNEYTIFANIADYRATLTNIGFDTSTDPEKTIHQLLTDKLVYIEEIDKLRKEAILLNNDLALLKSSNADTIATVENYLVRYNKLVTDYKAARIKLDTVVKAVAPQATIDAVLNNGFKHLSIYTGTFEEYIKTVIPKYDSLLAFESAIVKPKKVLESSVANPYVVTLKTDAAAASADTVNITFKEFSTTTSFSADPTTAASEIQQFRQQNDALALFVSTQMTSDEKKIFESHQLASGKSVAALLKEINTNITESDKVTKMIEDTDKLTFKTASSYISQMKKINTAYNKLSPIGKALTPLYEEKVAKKEVSGFNVGYLAAEEVVSSIAALKPAATTAYRDALTKATELEAKLDPTFTKYVVNKSNLVTMQQDLVKAQDVEATIKAIETSPTVAKITNARAAYKALSSSQRKVVSKDIYKDLQKWEKDAKASVKVNTTISKIKIVNKKTFATSVQKAQKSYDALSTLNKQMVELAPRLQLLTALSKTTGNYYSLKLSAKPAYRDGMEAVNTALDNQKTALTTLTPAATHSTSSADTIALEKVYDQLVGLVTPKMIEITNAKKVEDAINATNALANTPAKLTEILAARTLYEGLTKNEKKIVNNVKVLKALETNIKTPAKTLATILAVDPLATNFESKAKSAIKAYDKLTTTQKAYYDADIAKIIADYKEMVEFIAQMKKMKVTNPTFREDVEKSHKRIDELKSNFTSSKKSALSEALGKYKVTLDSSTNSIGRSDILVTMINNLSSQFGEEFLKSIVLIETEYAMLSANEKKLVTNYKQFTALKKDGTKASAVVSLINNSYITNGDVANTRYETAMTAAIKAYEKLTPVQRRYVYNYDSRIKPYLAVYDLVLVVNKMKPTNKTYWEEVNSARSMYEVLSPAEKKYAEPLLAKISGGETALEEVQKVMKLIDEATPESEDYMKKLQAARQAYDRLATINSAYQKLVLNYKTLTDREKSVAPIISSIHEIQELELILGRPLNNAADFVRKYKAAMKAYEQIPFESRPLVYNREVLLKTIHPVASTLEAISLIKESNKTFGTDVLTAREMYDSLSAEDQKLITNYNTLVAFEQLVKGGNVVDTLIRAIPTKSGQAYMQAIKDARAAYNQLSAGEKKAVTLLMDLQNYEKAVKNVQAAIDFIDALQFSSNLVTAYDKATAALDKLTAEQRLMVSNLNKLSSVAPAIEVYKMIANLKPSEESYAGSVQAAYASYNRLSNIEKQYVTNFAQLQEAKNNMDKLSAVIAKISEIMPGSRNYGTQVQEAMALYNSLPAAVKKLVTNYDVLKDAKSELDAVEKVRSLIAEIDSNSMTFVQKVIAARTAYDSLSTSQKRLVSNYFMLEEYEQELGTLF